MTTQTNKLLDFSDFSNHSDTYIETGTCYGGSVNKALISGFKRIKSVEVFQPFYLHCKELFKNNKNIELFYGKSTDELPKMLEDITKPCVFFLDAHPAGPGTGGHDDLMENGGTSEFHQDYILTNEIKLIISNNKNHIIIIDDQNGENPANQHYMKLISDINPSYKYFFYDEQAGDIFYKDKSLVCIPN